MQTFPTRRHTRTDDLRESINSATIFVLDQYCLLENVVEALPTSFFLLIVYFHGLIQACIRYVSICIYTYNAYIFSAHGTKWRGANIQTDPFPK